MKRRFLGAGFYVEPLHVNPYNMSRTNGAARVVELVDAADSKSAG